MDTHRHMRISGHLYESEHVNLLTANDCAIYFLFTIALAIVMYKSTIKFNCVYLDSTLFVVRFAHVTAFSLSTVYLQIQLGNQRGRNDKWLNGECNQLELGGIHDNNNLLYATESFESTTTFRHSHHVWTQNLNELNCTIHESDDCTTRNENEIFSNSIIGG